ncbi:AcrR family transcriptional regulator [Tistrella bauzanensis]|uniref:AcrR family transcriptional regulator n=1 Tax=Tistrella bauzanensis TaxID=657419 RepID=A0ABQ1J2T9_9PROT|nr:TetR/AcrR family transcriptional regulator [Tistrella bauzanensis]GGB56649.1 AcrR family transcriptional regulator [Tistrella bauzanensis]
MAYRRTKKVEERLARTREDIVTAALTLVAGGGYAAASMPAIAAQAQVSTGLLYRYFPSKADLFEEVFRRASQREIDACTRAAALPGAARDRLAAVVETFARRALKGPKLAWALLAEPVDPAIEAERLRYRPPYRDIFAGIIRDGIAAGEVMPQDADILASAIVGAIAEAMAGPLTTPTATADADHLVGTVTRFCVQALGPRPDGSPVRMEQQPLAATLP